MLLNESSDTHPSNREEELRTYTGLQQKRAAPHCPKSSPGVGGSCPTSHPAFPCRRNLSVKPNSQNSALPLSVSYAKLFFTFTTKGCAVPGATPGQNSLEKNHLHLHLNHLFGVKPMKPPELAEPSTSPLLSLPPAKRG